MSLPCDLLLLGGHVIDPRNGVDGVRDVAVRGTRVVAVGVKLNAKPKKTVNIRGLYLTPGLIDIHVHAFGGYPGWLFPDSHALPYGVTTVVDAGGSGWRDMARLRETIMDPATTRVLAFLNIVGAGMTGAPEQDVAEMDATRCAAAVRDNSDVIVGTKSAHFGGPGWESAGGAIAAARASGTIAMIDFAPRETRTYEQLLARMAPGDMHTHMYAAHIPLLDEKLQVRPYVRAARERGIVFDTGHGGGSLWFRIAIPALRQGFPPDTISTDLHRASRLSTDATMPTTLAKFVAMGMPLSEAVQRSTQNPAEVIRRPELGHLTPGAEADIAVFELRQGDFGFVDAAHTRLRGGYRLDCEMTLRAGRIVWDANGRALPDWDTDTVGDR